MKQVTFLFIVGTFMLLSSCITDNAEEVFASADSNIDLNDTNITYNDDVKVILTENCTYCHNAQDAEDLGSGIDFDSYDKLIPLVNDGSFLGVINHAPDFAPMPDDSPKLSNTVIEFLTKWVDTGAKEN